MVGLYHAVRDRHCRWLSAAWSKHETAAVELAARQRYEYACVVSEHPVRLHGIWLSHRPAQYFANRVVPDYPDVPATLAARVAPTPLGPVLS